MDARCRIELLGRLRVTQGEREITRFRTQKTGALLGYLAYHLGRTHPREVLMEILWLAAGPGPRRFDRGRLPACPDYGRRPHPQGVRG